MARPRTIVSCFGDHGLSTHCRDLPTSTPENLAELATIARALAHPARLAVIARFADRQPKLTKEFVAPSGLAASTMSEHLRILRDAGLIVSSRDGSAIWYCLCGDRLAQFSAAIEGLTSVEEAVSGERDLRP